jgi:hypothetical protein
MVSKHLALLALLTAVSSACIASAQPPDSQPPPADQYAPPDQNLQPSDQDVQQPDQYAAPADQYGQPPVENVQAPADGTVDMNFFYSNLAPHGHWVRHGSYGWVWLPYGIRAGWRPYTLGRWVMTDEGWTWISDEPFGWATYHYGRWVNDAQYGWGWVPGYQWAPAWVAWRTGNGYIGWAPLPPEARFRVGIGLDLGGVNLEVSLGASHFCFVEERSFLRPGLASYVVPPARNVTIVNNTTNITNYTVVNNRVINNGVQVQHIEQVTGQRVQRYQVAAVTSGSARSPQLHGNQLTVFRPTVAKRSAVPTPPPSARALASPATLSRQHQQETQTLQKSQAQERSRLQQIHQVEVKSAQASLASQQAAQNRQQNSQAQAAQEQQRQRTQQAQDNSQASQQRSAVNNQQLAQQHQVELKAQQDQHQREQQQLQARHQAEQAQARRPPPQRSTKAQGGQQQKDQKRPQSPPPPPR